jgi:hypothetical protein
MSRTLLLAEHPFRDLVSRALLADFAPAPGAPAVLVAGPAAALPPGFEALPEGADPRALGVTQVILGGVFLERPRLEAMLALAARAGAPLSLRNFGVEGDAAQRAAPAGAAVLDRATRIALRDHRSANVLTLWRLRVPFAIEPYPERHIAPDPILGALLPPGPVLGLAIRDGGDMKASWQPRLPAIKRLLAQAIGWPVLPLPIQGPGQPGDDMAGSLAFAKAVFDAPRVLMPRLTDLAWWQKEVTPARMKGLVARCALVVTNRDLIAAYAVAAGVPVQGIALGADRRIVSCLATLANDLPPGSDLAHPIPGA